MVGPNIIEISNYLIQSQVADTAPVPDHQHMLAAELMYFHNAPLAHVVAYQEHRKAKRLQAQMLRTYRERRTGSRARKHRHVT